VLGAITRFLLLFASLAVAALPAQADDYPSRPIRLIITTPAGSLVDVLAACSPRTWGRGSDNRAVPDVGV
jgi:tripartite-type tricarboxylate transporter receptor subunit TctC